MCGAKVQRYRVKIIMPKEKSEKQSIARKMSYGSQSKEGAKTREIWTSILQNIEKTGKKSARQINKSAKQIKSKQGIWTSQTNCLAVQRIDLSEIQFLTYDRRITTLLSV